MRTLREAWRSATGPDGADQVRVLPAPAQETIPLIMAGRGRQSADWLATNVDGHFTYHRPAPEMRPVAEEWQETCGARFRPLMTTMLLDLTEDPDAPASPIRFGARLGRNALVDYLSQLEKAQVAHVALNFRLSHRPVEEVMTEVAEHVLPRFSPPPPEPVSSAAQSVGLPSA